MLLKDLTRVYITTKQTEQVELVTVTKYINLRSVMANVQYATSYTHYANNTYKQQTYGITADSRITIRLPNSIQAEIGDGIYLSEPEPEADDGEYAIPEYYIESVETAYIGITSIRNPMIITARLNDDKNGNQEEGQFE